MEEKILIEMFPFGLSLGPITSRPVLLLKDKEQKHTLPVWLGQMEAAVALAALNMSTNGNLPHALLNKLMQKMDLKIESCVIAEMIGHHQYVDLTVKGPGETFNLRMRAEECMSACLSQKVPIFTTAEIIQQSRDMDAEIVGVERRLKDSPKLRQKNHSFLM